MTETAFTIAHLKLADTSTDVEELKLLASHPSAQVRMRVAANEVCPAELFEKFLADEFTVRAGLAVNKKCPTSLLNKLVTDEASFVRLAVAGNENLSTTDLISLSKDASASIVGKVILHERFPLVELFNLLKDERECIGGTVGEIATRRIKSLSDEQFWNLSNSILGDKYPQTFGKGKGFMPREWLEIMVGLA